jgi:hypothetical protein
MLVDVTIYGRPVDDRCSPPLLDLLLSAGVTFLVVELERNLGFLVLEAPRSTPRLCGFWVDGF